MNRKKCLLVQGVNGVLLEDLLEEHLAERGGKLVDQPPDAQILIVDNILLRVEDLAHLNGNLGFLIALGQIPQVCGNGSNAHHRTGAAAAEILLHGGGNLVELLDSGALRHLADQDHVPLAHAEDKVILPVRKHRLDHIRGHGLPLFQRAHHKYSPGHIGSDPQLFGAHIDVTQHDIIRDDILDKRAPVMLFLIVGLGRVQGHRGHSAHRPAHIIIPKDENRVIKLGIPSIQGLEGLAVGGDHGAGGAVYHRHMLRPALSDHGQLAARDHHTFPVDYADGPICIFL